MREIIAAVGQEVPIGRCGENLAARVSFDISEWVSIYGSGVVQLIHQRNGDSEPYPCVVERNGSTVTWDITNADTAVAGRGRAELQYFVGDAQVKSETYATTVERALSPVGDTPPEPHEAWVDKVLDAASQIEGGQGAFGDYKFVPEEEENEAYADAMAYNVASYFCNMHPAATDCVDFPSEEPLGETPFVPVYKDKEAVLYTNLLRYDAVIDNQSTFGHYVPKTTESTAPDPESGAETDTNTETDADTDSEPESGAAAKQRSVWTPTQDGNHDVLTVNGINYPIMYMACSNFLMLLTKNRAYEHSPWYRLFTDKDATPRQLAALCLEKGDTDDTPWTFDCLNVGMSWRIAEVMKSSGCTPFFVTSKSEDGVVTWDNAAVKKMRDGDIMFAGDKSEDHENRYKGIYHCMMYFRNLDRLNEAAAKWGVTLRGFDEARNMGFSGKYGYVVHCGGGTDAADETAYGVKIKNVIRIETMERFMFNTGKGVTVWGARAAANALNSTKLHQGVTGRMMLYDCALVSSYRHNHEGKTISYQYVEAMRSGKDKNNGVFSYGQYRYSQLRSPVTTTEIDGKTVKTLDFNDFVGSKKAGIYCVWNDDVHLVNGPTEGNVTEGSSVLASPTEKLFMLEVKCVSISPAYAIQRVSTLTENTPKVWERTFNYEGNPGAWREICDVTRVYELIQQSGGGSGTPGVDNERLSALEQRLEEHLNPYVGIEVTANSFATQERGAVVNSVTPTWKINRNPENLTISGAGIDGTLNLSVTDRSYTVPEKNLGITWENTNSFKWTITATGERGEVSSKQTPAITFLNGVYYGVAAQPETVDSAFVLGLTKKLSSAKISSFTVNAGAGQYIWYCLPERSPFGTCTFKVGGFEGGFTLVDTIDFENASNYTERYHIYRSDESSLGNTTVGVS